MAEKPTDREDPTPDPEVKLTPEQFEMLIRCVPKRHGGVRLRDLGGAHVEIEVLDAAGTVMKSRRLCPSSVEQASPSKFRRFVKERDHGEQE